MSELGQRLLESLQEAAAHAKGEPNNMTTETYHAPLDVNVKVGRGTPNFPTDPVINFLAAIQCLKNFTYFLHALSIRSHSFLIKGKKHGWQRRKPQTNQLSDH